MNGGLVGWNGLAMGMKRFQEEANEDLRAFWEECESFEGVWWEEKGERVSFFGGSR